MLMYSIQRAFGDMRKQAAAYLEREHYMRSAGGSGQMFAVIAERSGSVAGACLIGPAASQDAERSIAQPGVLIRQIKRSHIADRVPATAVCESKLLRTAMQAVCDEYDRPVLFVSYADPAATDERTGLPLAGWCNFAAGFFYAGETSSSRFCVIDHHGRARSTRQGAVTLTRRTLPRAGETFHGEYISRDWQMRRLPPARIWLAVTTPSRMTRRQAKHAWRNTWASLHPDRRVAARNWISHTNWRRKTAAGTVALGDPRPEHVTDTDRFQPAFWRGEELNRTAAPVWVPLAWQTRVLFAEDVEGETVARRQYEPLCI
jgi:hypothetical protein